jgi:hypothetical protein
MANSHSTSLPVIGIYPSKSSATYVKDSRYTSEAEFCDIEYSDEEDNQPNVIYKPVESKPKYEEIPNKPEEKPYGYQPDHPKDETIYVVPDAHNPDYKKEPSKGDDIHSIIPKAEDYHPEKPVVEPVTSHRDVP